MCTGSCGDLAAGECRPLGGRSDNGLKATRAAHTAPNLLTRHDSDAPLRLLTKGDNNAADDTDLYARGQSYLHRSEDVVGSVVAYAPFAGYVTILLSEYPWLKTAMLALMALTVVLQRE